VSISARFALLVATVSFGLIGSGLAGSSFAQAPKAKRQAQVAPAPAPTPSPSGTAAATPPAQPGWAVRCNSISRDAPLECAMEQNAILTKTGQVVVVVAIRVPGDTRAPIAFVQLPLGLNLQTGAKFQVDEGKAVDLSIQTCENRGCYASLAVTPDMVTALKSGKQLKVLFQDLAKETITIPMSLNDFAAAYDRIK
jgi:invasion protein IalB